MTSIVPQKDSCTTRYFEYLSLDRAVWKCEALSFSARAQIAKYLYRAYWNSAVSDGADKAEW